MNPLEQQHLKAIEGAYKTDDYQLATTCATITREHCIGFNEWMRKEKYSRVNDEKSDKFGLYVQNRPRLSEASFHTENGIFDLYLKSLEK